MDNPLSNNIVIETSFVFMEGIFGEDSFGTGIYIFSLSVKSISVTVS